MGILTDVFLSDIEVGDTIQGFYILKDAQSKVTANGKNFLSCVLSDCSGNCDAKVWDYNGPIGASDSGSIVKIRGEVTEFKDAKQINISNIRLPLNDDKYDLSRLVPVAPIDVDGTYEYVVNTANSIEDEDYKKIALEMLSRHKESFMNIPAAKSVHHSFLYGLLMHTANMLKAACFYADLYGDIVDRSLLLCGTILHDFAKEEEFSFSDYGTVVDYSRDGQLLGHLVMGAIEISKLCDELKVPKEKEVLLCHLVVSHHGEPEFGACVKPTCVEAELLSYLDLVDSRMEIYAETFNQMDNDTFSNRIFALEKKIYKHN